MKLGNKWQEFSSNKIVHPDQLEEHIFTLRKGHHTIATINGSFDLLHAGHMYMLFEASKQADLLFVLVNSDSSIKTYKSLKRPIVPLDYRMEMLSAIAFIDYISWFDETDPRQILEKIKPDVHINGIEYGPNCIESEVVKKHGGTLHLVERLPSLSTSALIETIQKGV